MDNRICFVIIVTFNGEIWIEKCLESIFQSSVKLIPIVIDNNSLDKTTHIIKIRFPDVILIKQKQNIGFGAANNIGISYAMSLEADFVLLLNQDVYLYSNTVEKLFISYASMKDAAILSPIHLNGKATSLDINFERYLKFSSINILFDSLIGELKNQYEISFVNAAAWFIPRKTIEKIGYFDQLFYHYSEDKNYAQRIIYHKLKMLIVPGSFILHDREVLGNVEIFKNRYVERNLLENYSNINYPFLSFRKELIKIHLNNIAHFFYYLFSFRVKKSFDILWGYCCFLWKCPAIVRSRKQNKKVLDAF